MARKIGRFALWLVAIVLLIVVGVAAYGAYVLKASEPRLDGEVAAGVSAPVKVERDAMGTATITAATRSDAAWALGYLHGQERFFQMDAFRRAAAGELGGLFGASQIATDRKTRVHRFRARAQSEFARLPADEKAMLRTYAAGVNQGLSELGHAPFEYAILMKTPEAWKPEDTALVVYAMYLDLQGALPDDEMLYGRVSDRLGPAMAAVLYPRGSELDAAIDGTRLPEAPLPAVRPAVHAGDGGVGADDEKPVKGSNNWAVSGAHTATGAAMLENDMHLSLRVPNIWYRARIKVPGLDITGVTLPGTPIMTAGSNGKIAWGYTDSYIDFHDAVLIEPAGKGMYLTPQGPKPFVVHREKLCAAECEDFPVEETIWGPVVATDARGRKIAMRWTAHDSGAVRLPPSLRLERASSVPEAIAIAHEARIPQQNLLVADRNGAIAWTIIGRVPRRYNLDGRTPQSWADGHRGWQGYYAANEVPVVLNPTQGRLWSANSRVVGGEAYAKLGDGFGDNGSRALRIHKRLMAKDKFSEEELLSIALDDFNERNVFWRQAMLAELERRNGDSALAAMIPHVRASADRADPESVGYRLVARFRAEFIDKVYGAWLGKPAKDERYSIGATDGGARRLLREKPTALVPPGFASWDAMVTATLKAVAEKAAKDDGGDLKAYRWGEGRTASIGHPLAKAIPLLGHLTDPKDEAVPGDTGTVRAAAPGFGASERFVVSPGHETSGIFHMPGGQAGNPWSPYYLSGHEDWVKGRPSPFLPGKTKWTMTLAPAKRTR